MENFSEMQNIKNRKLKEHLRKNLKVQKIYFISKSFKMSIINCKELKTGKAKLSFFHV